MPAGPDTGLYSGKIPIPSENTRITCSHTRHATPANIPSSQDTDVERLPTLAEAAQAPALPKTPMMQKGKTAQSPTTLHKVATSLAQIISKHNIPSQTRTMLSEIMETVKKENLIVECERTFVSISAVKSIQDQFKADLVGVHKALDSKISDLQTEQKKLLDSVDSLCRSTETLHTTTKDLEGRMAKVNDTTDKLANTTKSYRDAMMAKSANPNRTCADPKMLINVDRKARQILIRYDSDKENATINTSLLELKDKANKIVSELNDPSHPEVTKIESVARNRDNSLLVLLNSKEAADWLRVPDVGDRFLDKFAIGANIQDRSFNVLLQWVPITLNPTNHIHHREIEEVNNLLDQAILKMRWIKPVIRRRAGQTWAHATLTLSSAVITNRIIRDGIDICGVRTRAERTKQELMQCLKCRKWEHKAQSCEAQSDTCGTCGADHRTNDCNNKSNLFCVSCQSNSHTSWDRICPEFRRRCTLHDERYPENNMVYFPTDEDWTLTPIPSRVHPEERFPKTFAVNSLPVANRSQHRPVVRLSQGNPLGHRSPTQTRTRQSSATQQHPAEAPADRLFARSQSNLVPLG